MKKALVLTIAFLVLGGSAQAQWGVAFGFGHVAPQVAMPGFVHPDVLMFQQMQQFQLQRMAQLQAAAAYAPAPQNFQTQRQYQEEADARRQYLAARENRVEERIQELKEQQQKMETQFNNLLMVLLARQSPDPVASPSRGNVDALRSELQGLKDALGNLKQELSQLSTY